MTQEELIWSCIEPADNALTPANSDGYNEGEVYSTCVRLLQTYKESAEYKQIETDAKSWKALEEKLTDCNLTLHDKGKSIELIVNRK